MKRALACISLSLFPLAAQEAPKPDQPRPIAIKAARLFDGTSEGLVRNATVIVQGNQILAAGSNVAVPQNAEVIDLGDATLLPGFIDTHVHLTGEAGENWYLDFFESIMRQPAEQAHYAAKYAKATLEAGFTTVRNVGAGDYVDVGLRNAINAGLIPGPRVLTAVHAIGSTGGHGDGEAFPPSHGVPQPGPLRGICNGADECRAAVRYQLKYGADVIKFMPSGGVLSLSDPVDVPQLSQAEIDAIVEESHHWNRTVAAHAHGDTAGRMAVNAGVDSIEHGSFLQPPTLTAMKEKGVYLVPTLLAGDWVSAKIDKFPPSIAEKARAAVAARSEMFRNALRLGVKIAFGTDSGVSPHGLNAREFSSLVAHGMSPAAALRSATSNAAAMLKRSATLGSIEKGKLADIIAVPGNPLEDIKVTERVRFVMRDGRVIRNSR